MKLRVQENVPLAPLTTLGVGGSARFFAEARTETGLREAIEFARARKLPMFVLGSGSNLLVADAGFPGLVVRIAIKGIDESDAGSKRLFQAGAGEDWDSLVARAVEKNCGGIECLSGIPGTAGATPVQNVGAYGQEVSETITNVYALDLESGEVNEFSNEACGFAYRTSIFNTVARGRYIILGVRFALEKNGVPKIEYRDVKNYFAAREVPPSLQEVRDAVREIRRSKAMLIVAGDEDCRSAGSFFKNPVVSAAKFAEIEQLAEKRGLILPRFPAADGEVKIPAAWLVEQSGFVKGTARGRVGISQRHSLAIVNRGGATAAEIVALKDEIQNAVQGQFGIELRPEPVFLGFDTGH
ncbi:MAG TPA: UDP-N-acetylmuramate dehydrogenase [Candidatus Acidoferrales bacterium]|nr:UDP-N-acetylmuramate dehydrogenase [Candidatus Acidoferrales bacterium]